MLDFLKEGSAALSAIHPLVPYALISIATWLHVYCVRRWLPAIWLRLEAVVPESLGVPATNVLLALPGVAFGAAVAALGSNVPLSAAFYGAVSAGLAPIFHHVVKALPVPYRGAVGSVAKTLDEKARAKLSNISLLLTVFACVGCAGSFETARNYQLPAESAPAESRARCTELDDARTTWGAVAKGAAVLAGSGGIAALPVEGDEAKAALAIGALTAGTVSVVSVYVAENKGEAWARECSR